MPNVNLLAVVLAGIAGMVVGAIWYGPLLGKAWMKLVGFTKEDMDKAKGSMAKMYAQGFVWQLVTAYVLSLLITFTTQYFGGFSYELIFWAWLGLVVPVLVSQVLWERKPWGLFFLGSGYHLAQLLAMGAVLNYFI